MKERRRFVRIPEQAEISYKILPVQKTAMFLSKNISQGGIKFYVEDFVSQDSLIEIRIFIKEVPFSFKAVVKVIWIRREPHGSRYDIGVEFVNLPKEASEHLIQYIQLAVNKPVTD